MKNTAIITLLIILTIAAVFPREKPYKAGEKAEYLIHYGMVKGGVATLTLNEATLDSKKVWHSVMSAHTTGMADVLFKVRNIYQSYIDPATELPVKAIRDIREGKYKKYNEVVYDRTTRSDSAILTSMLTGQHVTEKGLYDILSCFYHFRKNYMPYAYRFEEGQVITIRTWFTDELYPIRLRYAGKEMVKTKAGRIMCYKFNPVTEVGRVFETEDAMSVWFSADKNYLPVMIRFDIFVGSVSVNLTDYEGLAHPLNLK